MKQFLFTKDRYYQNIYYRAGDIGVFPDDFTPPKDKHNEPICYPVGEAKEAKKPSEKSAAEEKARKEVETLSKKNKLGNSALEGLFQAKGAITWEHKLSSLKEFVEENGGAT